MIRQEDEIYLASIKYSGENAYYTKLNKNGLGWKNLIIIQNNKVGDSEDFGFNWSEYNLSKVDPKRTNWYNKCIKQKKVLDFKTFNKKSDILKTLQIW